MNRPARCLLAAVLLAALVSCVVPVPSDDGVLDIEFMSTDELRDYSESVFRRHNRVVTRRMMSSPPERSDRVRRLEQIERRMNRACAALNEIAAKRARGEDPGIELEDRVRRTVRDCDAHTRQLESLMDRFEREGGGSP